MTTSRLTDFITRIPLGERLPIDQPRGYERIGTECVVVVRESDALRFSNRKFSMPLPHYDLKKNGSHFMIQDGALVLRNEGTHCRGCGLVGEN